MAVGDTTTKNGVAATAFQYDQSASPALTPAACVADGYNGKFGLSTGHKVQVDSGTGKKWQFPANGDWVVTAGGKVFLVPNAAFTALFNTPA